MGKWLGYCTPFKLLLRIMRGCVSRMIEEINFNVAFSLLFRSDRKRSIRAYDCIESQRDRRDQTDSGQRQNFKYFSQSEN